MVYTVCVSWFFQVMRVNETKCYQFIGILFATKPKRGRVGPDCLKWHFTRAHFGGASTIITKKSNVFALAIEK